MNSNPSDSNLASFYSTISNGVKILCKLIIESLSKNEPIELLLIDLNNILRHSGVKYSVHSVLFPLFLVNDRQLKGTEKYQLKEKEVQLLFVYMYNSITIYKDELLNNQENMFEKYFLWYVGDCHWFHWE